MTPQEETVPVDEVPDTELVERLKASAENAAKAMQIMADAKTARQTDRDDYPELAGMGYGAPTKEQTLEWKAADRIESLSAEIGRLADFIMHEVPGEPSEDEGAVDCAIRIIRTAIGDKLG